MGQRDALQIAPDELSISAGFPEVQPQSLVAMYVHRPTVADYLLLADRSSIRFDCDCKDAESVVTSVSMDSP